ncbi:MAG TPA: HAMP domain-containing sensor histidine kinase [Sphingobacteriaceae bacterium]
MFELVNLTLENEMDLVLAQKKAVKVAEILKLTLSTQATFATAITELCRVVIDFTDTGILCLGLIQESNRYSLTGTIKYQTIPDSKISEESYYYAKKLVPTFTITLVEENEVIEVRISLPRSIGLNREKILNIQDFFINEPPISAYEEIKKRNFELFLIAEDKNAQLKQSKYIDDKRNEFISIASHELKTPITIIKAFTQLALSKKTQCSDQVIDFLMKIDAQSTKLKNLVQQLMDSAKIENGKLEYNYQVVDFNIFIEETTFLITHLLPAHRLIIDVGPNVQVKIDRERIDQVLTNLISNAGKYSKTGSLVTLRTAVSAEGDLTVSIDDEGIGMSKDNMEKAFEKFHRDDEVINRYAGLGMGLYIASEIIKDHSGKMWVESIKGEGSTFYFSLPCCAAVEV